MPPGAATHGNRCQTVAGRTHPWRVTRQRRRHFRRGVLARREPRLAEIARARAIIEARAKERHAREQADYDTKTAAREAKAAATGSKPGGRPPTPPKEGPGPADQVNLTDEGRRIRRPHHGGAGRRL